MKLNENQIAIKDQCLFLNERSFKIDLPTNDLIDNFTASEMDRMNSNLRYTIFKKIERMMFVSPFYKDLYSVTLPNEQKLHEEKLRYMRQFVGRFRDTMNYTDRIKFTFTIIDPECKYAEGVYEQYSQLNFENMLNDARKIVKSIVGNHRLLHQRNMKTLEQFEIYESNNSDFVYKICFYPHKKIWIELESRE